MLDTGSGRAHEKICRRDALDGPERLSFLRRGIAIDLRGIEDPRCARDAAFAVIAFVLGIGVRVELLVEDDKARLLVFADLGNPLLTIGGRLPRRALRRPSPPPPPRG